MTIDLQVAPSRRTATEPLRLVAITASVALAGAAVWEALMESAVTVAAPPEHVDAGVASDDWIQGYFAWLTTTLRQERAVVVLAVIAMFGLAVLAASVAGRLGLNLVVRRVAAYAAAGGAVLWSVGGILIIGGHHAVTMMAAWGNPIAAVDAVGYTLDNIEASFQVAALALLGCALVAFTLGRAGTTKPSWRWYSIALGLLCLVPAAPLHRDDLGLYVQLAIGVLLLPVWMIWTSALARTEH
jgi:hypothetical protein